MKPLWPDSNEILGEKDSEENKSTEQDQVLSILIKSFGFLFLYRIHCSLFLSEENNDFFKFCPCCFQFVCIGKCYLLPI